MKYLCLVYLEGNRLHAIADAANHDEALQIAARIPPAREGSIEVRPVREMQPDVFV